VRGLNLPDACRYAWWLKVNPGGEVLGRPVPDWFEIPAHYQERLLTREEAMALDAILATRRAEAVARG
jgi:hypothetical protein